MILRRMVQILLLGLAAVLLSGCLHFLRYMGPCRLPKEVTPSSIVGTWQTHYDNYKAVDKPSSRISGTETLVINADGTYRQRFKSSEYNYDSPHNRWQLVLDEGDGPKITMSDFVYFANGLDNIDGPLTLSIQIGDELRYLEAYPRAYDRTATLVVDYPDDGFVYLYPRLCFDKFALLQMDSGNNDPDAQAIEHPAFTKVSQP